jgi:hypothetical protein
MARYDVMAAALGFSAVAVHLRARSERPYLAALAGLLVGLAFEIHTNGALYGLAIVALAVLRSRWAAFRDRRLWWFAAGAAAGLSVYAALHVVRYPGTYLALNKLIFAPTHTPPILTFDLLVILQSLGDTGRLLWDSYWVLPPLILWALVALARRGSDEDHVLLVLCAVLVFGAALLIRNRPTYYAILISPSVDLVMAAFLHALLERSRERSVAFFARHAVVWSLCAAAVVHNVLPLSIHSTRILENVERRIEASLRPGDSIMAAQTYWFGLHDRVFTPWEMLVYYRRYQPAASLEGALRVFRPDIFVVDGQMEFWIRDEPGDNAYTRHLVLPRSELSAILSRRGEIVDAFDGGPYGSVVVIRLSRTD